MRFLKNTMILAAAVAIAASCQEPLRGNEGTQDDKIGYLSFADGIDVDIVVDHKHTDGGVKTFDEGEAAIVDINTFDCFIYDVEGNLVENGQFKYADRPTAENPLNLKAGNYTLKMVSGTMTDAEGNAVDAAFECPIYGLTKPFTINIKQTTELTNLVCTLQNIQASITYDADLKAALSDDTIATLTVGNGSLDYSKTETRSGFFTAAEEKNDLDILIKGTYTAEGKLPAEFEFTYTIKDVVAGQHRDIELFIKYSDDGNININVSVDGWVIDEVVTFDLASVIKEDVMVDDSDKPTITLVAGDITQPIEITSQDFDANGNYTKSVVVEVAAKSAIKSLQVDITGSAAMIASLADFGLSESFDLCNMTGFGATSLNLMGIPCNEKVAGKSEVTYTLTNVIGRLKEYMGLHKFTATVTDENGGVTTQTLAINIKGDEPIYFVWNEGANSIDTCYTIDENLTVNLVANAAAGIKEFIVTITSTNDTLSPASLVGIGLCDVMNLVNPTASYSTADPNFDASGMGTQIKNLGFPIEDEVKDRVSVPLTIAPSFLGMLGGLSGEHNFEMKVTDNDGNTVVKTLMLKSL